MKIRREIKTRPGWDEYFINLAKMVKTRSNCMRRQVGAILVKEKQIIASGYSGTPKGIKNCDEGGCRRCSDREKNLLKTNERKDLCICICAEQNSLIQAAYHGISTRGTTLYATISPCLQCARLIINAGVVAVVFPKHYQNTMGLDLLKSARVKVRRIK